MSKAFTREDDALPEQPEQAERISTLPQGARNYLAPAGATRLRTKLEVLQSECSRLTSASEPEAKRQLLMLNRQIEELLLSLQTAEVVPAPNEPHDRVRFGATVTVRERNGDETNYRIIGADEIDLDRGWVSWMSPIAKALLNARLGQRVRFKFPAGETELEVMRITYEDE